ncbi:Sterol O-acyltransferase 2 (Sterol-ester synthase 2) [Cryptotrichosporon argae]
MVATRSSSRTPETPPPPPPRSPTLSTTPSSAGVAMTAMLSATGETTIPTSTGTIRVRPYRTPSSTKADKFKAVLSFEPRHSSFDRENKRSQTDEFRGFFTLFWICLALLFVRTSLDSWDAHRTLLSLNFGYLITRDVAVLAFADLVMVASMLLAVPFVKCLQHRYFSYYWTGVAIQHAFQAAYLGVAIWWGWARQWYWVQSGFLVLHCLASLMKIHSYMAHNGLLSTVYFRLQDEKRTLDQYVDSLPGGYDAVIAEAAARQVELEEQEAAAGTTSGGATPLGTPGVNTPASIDDALASASASALSGAASSTVPPAIALSHVHDGDLRKRATAGSKRRALHPATDALPAPAKGLPLGTSLEPSHHTTPHRPRPVSQLAWSADDRVALLARNVDQMDDELRSNGPRGLAWPENVTYRHFFEFMFFPTLVYQLEYPRTNSIRPLYVLEKILATFGTFSLIYLITEHYIMPYTPKPGHSLLHTFVQLALPMIVNYLLIFYIIFECVCAGFAELSYFADREFYQDWWNSTSWDEFSRKWNKPVHTFLLRHVYASTMSGLRFSRTTAMMATFLLSALCHELVMAVVTKKIRPYLFLMQMIQLPMIAVGRLPIVRRNKTIGNIVFWIGLMMGFPLLAICYLVF